MPQHDDAAESSVALRWEGPPGHTSKTLGLLVWGETYTMPSAMAAACVSSTPVWWRRVVDDEEEDHADECT